MKKQHQRPEKDFRVTCLAWEISIEQRHTAAGFDPVPHVLLVRRYFQFLRFLQEHGMTRRTVCSQLEDVMDQSEWRNADLTDEGFYFTQKFHGRWLNRTRKDRGEVKEEAFLEKWLAEFVGEKS